MQLLGYYLVSVHFLCDILMPKGLHDSYVLVEHDPRLFLL